MRDGVTFIDIECVKVDDMGSNVIAIFSNIEQFKEGKWMGDIRGHKFWWFGGVSILVAKDEIGFSDYCDTDFKWLPNDIITIKADLNVWKLTFYFNKREIYTVALEKEIEYYFGIAVDGEAEYLIL